MEDRRRIWEKLLLPQEFLCGEIRAELLGNRELFVENYRGIVEVSECRIVLKGKKICLVIQGEELHILHYTGEDMVILGRIRHMDFCE